MKMFIINNIIKRKRSNKKGYYDFNTNKVKKDKRFINNYKEYNLNKKNLCLVDFKMIIK